MSGISRDVFSQVRKRAEAALQNEELTRERVARLEAWAKAFSRMSLKERLRWLLLGR